MERVVACLLSTVCCGRQADESAAEQSRAAASKAQAAALLKASKVHEVRQVSLAEPPCTPQPSYFVSPLFSVSEECRQGGAAQAEEGSAAGESAASRRVEQLEVLVQRLQRECVKHPKGGRSTFTRSKARYFAAVPAEEPAGNSSACRWDRWYRGSLKYWKDSQSYMKQEPPKGAVNLLSIVKVVWDRDHPEEVMVRHLEGKDRHEMVLKFSNMTVAKEWSMVLTEVLTSMHRRHGLHA